MQATPYADINELIELLLLQMQEILGKNLEGLYLYGSLVWGDFDYDISDIDLLVVTATDINKKEFRQLKKMQAAFATKYKAWAGRLEIAYVSLQALKTFKTQGSQIAVISPGEPFHIKEAGKDWLINWYTLQEKGVTLFGPAPKTFIEPISKAEFIQVVKEQAGEWREWITQTKVMRRRNYQAYAILTMCRAFYAYKFGEQVSKKQAALWAQKELPKWSGLIKNALEWREDWRNKKVDHEATISEARCFVNFVVDQIIK